MSLLCRLLCRLGHGLITYLQVGRFEARDSEAPRLLATASEHLNRRRRRIAKTPGSNPGVPTNQTLANSNRSKANLRLLRRTRETSPEGPFRPFCRLLLFYWVRIRTHFRTR